MSAFERTLKQHLVSYRIRSVCRIVWSSPVKYHAPASDTRRPAIQHYSEWLMADSELTGICTDVPCVFPVIITGIERDAENAGTEFQVLGRSQNYRIFNVRTIV